MFRSMRMGAILIMFLCLFPWSDRSAQAAVSAAACSGLVNRDLGISLCDAERTLGDSYWSENAETRIEFASCRDYQVWSSENPIGKFSGWLEVSGNDLARFEASGRYLFTLTVTPLEKSTITVLRPTWPGIDDFQRRQVAQQVAAVLEHERGHLNLLGWAARKLSGSYAVQAETEEEAQRIFPRFYNNRLAEIYHLADIYDDVTGHGILQERVGGQSPIPIRCQPALAVRSIPLPEAINGQSCFHQLKMMSEETDYSPAPPVAWSIRSGAFPPGLWLNASNGLILGSPQKAGAYRFTVSAVDGRGYPAEESFVIVVHIRGPGGNQAPNCLANVRSQRLKEWLQFPPRTGAGFETAGCEIQLAVENEWAVLPR